MGITMRRNKKFTKIEEKEFKRYCRMKKIIIGGFYLWEECCKMYVYLVPVLIAYNMLSKLAALILTPIAIVGSLCAFVGKMTHLRHTKFRKSKFMEGR